MSLRTALLLVVVVVVCLASLSLVDCKRKEGKKKHKANSNICVEQPEAAMVCQCNYQDVNSATEATCWVFGGPVPAEDPIWEHFQSQTNLERLKLNARATGTIPSIPTTAFKYTRRLETLEILYGAIPELESFVFSNLSSLSEISLSRNKINTLRPYSFSYLMNLTTVNLDENRISELPRNVFVQVPRLKMLYIDRCNLSIIHDNAFEHLHALDELELSGNQISILTRETFSGLGMLKRLDLRSNRLVMLGDYTFSELANLYELDLDQNKIEFVSEKAFYGLKRLSKLRMSENALKELGDTVFMGSTSIQFLDLRNNQLETVNFDTLEPIWENLKNYSSYIYLDKNMLKCDCHIAWTYSLRNETNSEAIRTALEELTCIPEKEDDETLGASITATEPTMVKADDQSDAAGQYDDYEYEVQYEELSSEVLDGRKHIFSIPQDKLPCPEMQKATTTRDFPTGPSLRTGSMASHLAAVPSLLCLLLLRTMFLT